MRQFYNIYQDKHATCQSYLEKFQNCVDVLDHCLWWIHWVYTRTGERNSRRKQFLMATKEQMADAMKASQDKYLAVAFLLGSDQNRYRKLIKNLENDYTQGQNCCPKTLTTAYSLLTNWKQDAHNNLQFLGPAKDGMSFTNTDGNDNEDRSLNTNARKPKSEWLKDRANITCHMCLQKGHYANECTNKCKVER
jgi:hypothetical protein